MDLKHRTWSKSCLRPPGTTSRAQGEPSHGGWAGRRTQWGQAGRRRRLLGQLNRWKVLELIGLSCALYLSCLLPPELRYPLQICLASRLVFGGHERQAHLIDRIEEALCGLRSTDFRCFYLFTPQVVVVGSGIDEHLHQGVLLVGVRPPFMLVHLAHHKDPSSRQRQDHHVVVEEGKQIEKVGALERKSLVSASARTRTAGNGSALPSDEAADRWL